MFNCPIVQTKFLQNRLSITRQTFQLIERLFGRCQFYQLNFLKLMLPVDAACVPPIATGLGTKTRRVSRKLKWQRGSVQDFIAVIIRDRHFAGWYQIKTALVGEFKKVLFKFRQLSCAKKRVGVDYERRQRFGITILASLHVKHEVDEGTAKPRTRAIQDSKARAG